MIDLLFSFIVAVITYVMGKASKKFGWNEELAIPVQNFLIAIAAFGALYFLDLITGQTVDVQKIIQYIETAIMGVGGATLYYDGRKSLKE